MKTIESDGETTFVLEVEFRGLDLTNTHEYEKYWNISKRIIDSVM